MKIILLISVFLTSTFFISAKSSMHANKASSEFSRNKFFVKTNKELKISEATGKVMMPTGYKSLDEKIDKYGVVEIRNLFRLNNGNPEVYYRLGMERIYVFITDENCEYSYGMDEIADDFGSDGNVEYGEPNYIGMSAGVKESAYENFIKKNITPNDEMFYKQWYLQNNGSVNPSSGGRAKVGADIKIIDAWEIETGSEDVIVAILDSGIKDDHPDLSGRIWINKDEIPGNGIDDDYNGYIDDVRGWDFAYDDRKPEDGFGHGTNIATVIGASTNNNLGFAGIDMKCRLMNCKNLSSYNSGEYAWWSESIKYAVDNGADVINMSEGGDDFSKVLKTAIEYALENDVMVVAAMMNKGDGRDYYPASYKGVFSVGATDTDDKRCRKFSWGGGSCWGSHISVVAPGNRIYGLDYENDDNFDVYWSGTSQSTAIVSAIASLLKSQNKNRTSDEIKKIIRLTSKDLVGDLSEDKPGWDKYYGYGRVDTYAALNYDNVYDKKEEVIDEQKQDEKIIQDETLEQENDNNKRDNYYKEDEPAEAVDRKSKPEPSK